jgi:hypothetical protein
MNFFQISGPTAQTIAGKEDEKEVSRANAWHGLLAQSKRLAWHESLA